MENVMRRVDNNTYSCEARTALSAAATSSLKVRSRGGRYRSLFDDGWTLDPEGTALQPECMSSAAEDATEDSQYGDAPAVAEQMYGVQEYATLFTPEPLHTDSSHSIKVLDDGYHLWTVIIDKEEERKRTQWSLSFAPGDYLWKPGTHIRYWNDVYEVLAVGVQFLRVRHLQEIVPVGKKCAARTLDPAPHAWVEMTICDNEQTDPSLPALAAPFATYYSYEVPVEQLPARYQELFSEDNRVCWIHELRETVHVGIYVTRLASTPHSNGTPIVLDVFDLEDREAIETIVKLTQPMTTPCDSAHGVVRALPRTLLPDSDSIRHKLCSSLESFALKEGTSFDDSQVSPWNGMRLSPTAAAHVLALHDIFFLEETGVYNDEGHEQVLVSALPRRLDGHRQSGPVYRVWLPTEVIQVGLVWDSTYEHLESHEQCRLVASHLSECLMTSSYMSPSEASSLNQQDEEPTTFLPLRMSFQREYGASLQQSILDTGGHVDDDRADSISLPREAVRGCKKDQKKLLKLVAQVIRERLNRYVFPNLEQTDERAHQRMSFERLAYRTGSREGQREVTHLSKMLNLLRLLEGWYCTLPQTEGVDERVLCYQSFKEDTTVQVFGTDIDKLLNRPTTLHVKRVAGYKVKVGVPIGVTGISLDDYKDLLVLPTPRTIRGAPPPIEFGSKPMKLDPKSLYVFK